MAAMRLLLIVSTLLLAQTAQQIPASPRTASIVTRRIPNGGIQPQAVRDPSGAIHLLYFAGEPAAGDLFYVRSKDDGITFSPPLRVNRQAGSAIAVGTVRGGQLTLGRNGRPHVVWNGSGVALPKGVADIKSKQSGAQLLYSRLNDARTAFEPQRGLMTRSVTLDGGGSVAADATGNVYVAWHGNDANTGNDGEANRRVWISRSTDDGRTFAPETAAWNQPTGACGCCGLGLLASRQGLFLLYRSATKLTQRDIYVLASSDKGRTFDGARVDPWQLNACPMSTMSLAESPVGVVGAWETAGQVHLAHLMPGGAGPRAEVKPPAGSTVRKHPRLATNGKGETLLVWTEGTSWARGGGLAWRVFDRQLAARLDARGTIVAGVPAWSFAAPVARQDGGFTIFY